MSATPAELLALARSLLSRTFEVEWRASTSRAYYAVHHLGNAACSRLRTSQAVGRFTRPHQQVVQDLSKFRAGDPGIGTRVRTAGILLQQCLDLRTPADYDLSQNFSAG